jgi:hypothetical protein
MSRILLQRILKVLKVKRLRLDEHLIPIIVEEIEAELAKPEQEPVVEVQSFGEKQVFVVLKPLSDGDKLYTAPPRNSEQVITPISPDQYERFCGTCGACTGKPWVGLTEGELIDILNCNRGFWVNAA